MKIIRLAIIGSVAALLATPPATAADKTQKGLSVRSAAQGLVDKGLADLKARAYDAAIQEFGQAVKISPESSTYFLLGYAHYQRGFQGGDPDSADKGDARQTVSAYTEAMALDPELGGVSHPYRLYHSLALSYEALKAYDQAVGAYKQALLAAPDNPMIPLYAARLRYRMGDVPKASSNLALSLQKARLLKKEAQIIRTVKNDPLFSVLLAAPENQALIRDAQAVREPEARRTTVALALTSREVMHDSLNDQGPSLAQGLAAAVPVQNLAVMETLSKADEQFKFRQYRAALDLYQQVLKLDAKSSSLNPVQASIVYERMGVCDNRLGLAGDAILALQRSLQAMPGNAAARYQLALAYSLEGRFTQSLRALSETFKSAPSRRELRGYMIQAKTDVELEPVRDLAGFASLIEQHQDSLARR